MENNSSGSFGAPAGGGGNAIAQAMQSRGMDASVLDQVTAGAPTAATRAPLPQPVPQSSAPGLPSPGQPGSVPSDKPAESETIVKALSSRLKRLGDLTEQGFSV